MPRGSTQLDNYEYDDFLASKKKEKELMARTRERKRANKGGEGWHFGIDSSPVYAKDLSDFRRKLNERGLAIEGEYKGDKRKLGYDGKRHGGEESTKRPKRWY